MNWIEMFIVAATAGETGGVSPPQVPFGSLRVFAPQRRAIAALYASLFVSATLPVSCVESTSDSKFRIYSSGAAWA